MGYVYHTSPYLFDVLEPRSEVYEGEAGLEHIKFACATSLEGAKLIFGLNIRGNVSLTNGGTMEMTTIYDDFEYLTRVEPSYIYALKDDRFVPYYNRAAHEYVTFYNTPVEYYIEFYPEDYVVSIWRHGDKTKILYNAKKIETEIRPILNILNYANDLCGMLNVSKTDKDFFFDMARFCIKTYNMYHFDSYQHDIFHSLRVMTYVLLLSYSLQRTNNLRELLFAAAFHDCGKSLQFDVQNHGSYSYTLSVRFAREFGLDLDLVQKLMVFHDKEDVAKQDPLISILRDADIIDLPRVGIVVDPDRMSYPEIAQQYDLL